ncbi:MAG TPA: hypothetical protein VMF03_19465 [Steroidobacteraceae bacterium]|nr:hypothetical protein [Steroidobacteraceae bacterium]
MARYQYLDDYQFSGCAIRRSNLLTFFGQIWGDTDSLQTRPTAAFFCNTQKPADARWAYRKIGEATGIHGLPVFVPDERWLFVMDDGFVYVVGQGEDAPEKPVSKEKHAFFQTARCIEQHAYAVGPLRRVFRRDARNKWVRLDAGLPKSSGDDSGFDDIDGFSASDLYACGGQGDLWSFDGKRWSRIDVPTNAALWHVVCGVDGLVYVMTDQRKFLVGRGDSWRIIEQDKTEDVFEDMVWYEDRVYVSTVDALYEIVKGVFKPSRLKPPAQESYAHMAAGDGVLLVAGSDEASLYDGKKWTVVLKAP